MSKKNLPHQQTVITLESPLEILDPNLVHQVDHALTEVGAFGEVRLIVAKGQLRFIQMMQSERVGQTTTKQEIGL